MWRYEFLRNRKIVLGFLLRLVVSPRRRRDARRRLVVASANIVYLLMLLAIWTILRSAAESWWLATLMLFGPRWVYGLPLLALIPATFLLNRRAGWILGVAALVLLFPLMDFCIPWRVVFASRATGPQLRLLTCNIHRHMLSGAEMAGIIDTAKPDIVLMQEWTSQDQLALFSSGQWYVQRDGELFLASRYPITGSEDLIAGHWGPAGAAVCYHINVDGREIRLINLHLASPHIQFADTIHGDAGGPDEMLDNSAMRHDQSILISSYAGGGGGGAGTILAGDFNTPDDSPIFQSCWKDFADGFSYAGLGLGNTYFTRWSSTRIDHILAGGDWQFTACRVGPDAGSPHHPVIADLVWTGPAVEIGHSR
jgi:endonuclease/exonuclease/phosphatase (EEP) superfamily protein YafD